MNEFHRKEFYFLNPALRISKPDRVDLETVHDYEQKEKSLRPVQLFFVQALLFRLEPGY